MRGTTLTMTNRGGNTGRQGAPPYRIPGPAGFGFGQTEPPINASPSQVASAVRNASEARARPFDTTAWHALLRAHSLKPYGTEVLKSSVALVKSEALRQVSVKTRLAVRVEKLSFLGKDGSVTLADPTGSIAGTVHAEVFADRKCGVEEGAVLFLRNISAQYYPERRQTGFHADENEALHLSVQLVNIERVFGQNDDRADLPRQQGVMPYSNVALRPPKVSRQTIRRQRASPSSFGRRVQRTPTRLTNSSYGTPQNTNVPRPQSASMIRPQSSFGSGAQRQQEIMQFRPPPVHRSGLHAPRATLQRGIHDTRNQQANRELNKRPGAQSFPSQRPPQRPRHQGNIVSDSRVENHSDIASSAPDALTDDQLDDLLGNVDIEAAIAAATQTSSPPEKENTAPSVSQPNKPSPSLSPPAVVDRLSSLSAATAAQSRLPTHETVSAAINSHVESSATNLTPDETASAAAVTAPEASSATNGNGIGGIDDSILDGLLDGLDGTDFS